MNNTCARCPCPDLCSRRPADCDRAMADPVEPRHLRAICDRGRIARGLPAEAVGAPEYPPLMAQARGLAGAVGRILGAVARGDAVRVPPEVLEARLAACAGCPEWAAEARRCRKCGCHTDKKLALATERCPLDPPRWDPWGDGPE